MISGDKYIGSLKSERMAIFPAMKESIVEYDWDDRGNK